MLTTIKKTKKTLQQYALSVPCYNIEKNQQKTNAHDLSLEQFRRTATNDNTGQKNAFKNPNPYPSLRLQYNCINCKTSAEIDSTYLIGTIYDIQN